MAWSAAFDTPIVLEGGGELVTLLDAGAYIAELPAATQRRREWQDATEALLLVAELGGPTMMARIGVMRALNRGITPPGRVRRARAYRLIR